MILKNEKEIATPEEPPEETSSANTLILVL